MRLRFSRSERVSADTSIKVVQRLITPLLAFIVLLLSIALVAAQSDRGLPAQEGGDATVLAAGGCWHRVTAGETLRSISRDYFGSSRYWRLIQQSNGAEVRPAAGVALWIPATFSSALPDDVSLAVQPAPAD